MPIITDDDRAFFHENGYVLIKNMIPKPMCNAVVKAIFDFLGMDENNPEDWYRLPLTPGGMIEMYHHQSMWDVRQYPPLHQMFAELLGTEKLWVTLDRVNMKPPQHPDHPEYDHKGFTHWDADTSNLDRPLRVQGVLYLADAEENTGGFQCIPGFHNDLPEWIKTQPADRNPHVPDMNSLPPGRKLTPILGKAGDFVVWNTFLAHGNGRNTSQKPRLAQFVSMYPANATGDNATREERIEAWKNREPIKAPYFFGDPRRIEQETFPVPALTPLGEKLLGLKDWE